MLDSNLCQNMLQIHHFTPIKEGVNYRRSELSVTPLRKLKKKVWITEDQNSLLHHWENLKIHTSSSIRLKCHFISVSCSTQHTMQDYTEHITPTQKYFTCSSH